jgi:hypothetical protein
MRSDTGSPLASLKVITPSSFRLQVISTLLPSGGALLVCELLNAPGLSPPVSRVLENKPVPGIPVLR